MPPTGGETSNRNGRLNQQLFNWADVNGTGIAFDSSGGFKLQMEQIVQPLRLRSGETGTLGYSYPEPKKFIPLP